MAKQAKRLDTETYSLEINYDETAVTKKLIKFIPKEGIPFEISAEDMISFLVNQVNMNTLEPTFVDTEKINICDVYREIKVKLDRDFKEGEIIQLGYKTPYPLEFAVLEAIYNIAKVEEGAEVFSLTKEMIYKYKTEIKPEQVDYVKKFYEGHKGLNLGSGTK
jgi:hypothetical protein